MKWILQWLRSFGKPKEITLPLDAKQYAAFEQALENGDVQAYVYDKYIKGSVIVLRGSELHQVTPQNLVSFRLLNRMERRHLDKQGAKLVRQHNDIRKESYKYNMENEKDIIDEVNKYRYNEIDKNLYSP